MSRVDNGVITWLSSKLCFSTPLLPQSTSEQQNRSNRQEDAGMNSSETGCAATAAQWISTE